MTKQFSFLGGLPRSGSTLLASILSQNPAVYASPNSALVELLVNVRKHLRDTEQAQAFSQPTQTKDVLQHIMLGMYHFTNKPYVIDKSRAWPHPLNIELLTDVLGRPPKLIAMVRDLPAILTSFITLMEQQTPGISYIDQSLQKSGRPFTTVNRCEVLFSPGGTVYESWYSLQLAFEAGYRDHFLLIEYDEFVARPEHTLAAVYDFLELPAYTHDLTRITNHAPEDDTVYNIAGLHEIRPSIAKTSADPETVLGRELVSAYAAVPHFWRHDKASQKPNPFMITVPQHQL